MWTSDKPEVVHPEWQAQRQASWFLLREETEKGEEEKEIKEINLLNHTIREISYELWKQLLSPAIFSVAKILFFNFTNLSSHGLGRG